MAENKKMCPHCGATMFAAKIIHAGIVLSADDGSFTLQKENPNYEVEVVKCGGCKKEITNSDLIAGVACKECGSIVNANELDENGLCVVCQAKKADPRLNTTDINQLIRMLIAERQEAKIANVQSTMREPEAAVSAPIQDAATTETVPMAEPVAEDKPKRRARRKGTEDTDPQEPVFTPSETNPVDVAATEAAMPQVPTEAINELANSQEAPFPDVVINDELPETNPATVNTNSADDEPIGINTFAMFDADDAI